jgi:hypothetical protein
MDALLTESPIHERCSMTDKDASASESTQGTPVPESPAPSTPAAPPEYDVRQGLYEYYSSQAQSMLAQYDNIRQLLGPTTDWTAPGTLCETLIRDLLRRSLPSMFSVDKGFIFGRRMRDGQEVHSPEIDVLVHDTHLYCPVYRLEDFVIVDPRAVRAVVQVKRSLTGPQLKEAINNLVGAKQHLLDSPFWPKRNPADVFSAAVFFNDEIRPPASGVSRTYRNTLCRAMGNEEPLVRPDFIGSILRRFYIAADGLRVNYTGYLSTQQEVVTDKTGTRTVERNIALLVFLGYLCYWVRTPGTQLQFYRRSEHRADEEIEIPRPAS